MAKIKTIYVNNLQYTPATATEGIYDHDAPQLPEGAAFIVKEIRINIIRWVKQGLGFSLYPEPVELITVPAADWIAGAQKAAQRVKELNTIAGIINERI